MPEADLFHRFFQGEALGLLHRALDAALDEDGQDLASRAVFPPSATASAAVKAKEATIVAGLPLIPLIAARITPGGSQVSVRHLAEEGERVDPERRVSLLQGPTAVLLRAERVILNFVTHLSGIANLTHRFARALEGSRTRVLDTRKTLPGLRYPEKYAVRLGGGSNHRFNLSEMLMLKDNHIDACGSIEKGVSILRATYSPCPPIEVECRSVADVREAVGCGVERIMLDNMSPQEIARALGLIPQGIESEISGGISLDNIERFARLGADYISVGGLTSSAPAADFNMKLL
jgi:nicotinate-nucleotide pyrophosphorylase (carboxylating)